MLFWEIVDVLSRIDFIASTFARFVELWPGVADWVGPLLMVCGIAWLYFAQPKTMRAAGPATPAAPAPADRPATPASPPPSVREKR